MDARTVNNMPPAATHDEAVRCLMAIELSKKSWIIGSIPRCRTKSANTR
jgi:transposase